MKKMNFPGRRKQRREEAEARQEVWNSLTTEDKMKQISDRGFGEGWVEYERLKRNLSKEIK